MDLAKTKAGLKQQELNLLGGIDQTKKDRYKAVRAAEEIASAPFDTEIGELHAKLQAVREELTKHAPIRVGDVVWSKKNRRNKTNKWVVTGVNGDSSFTADNLKKNGTTGELFETFHIERDSVWALLYRAGEEPPAELTEDVFKLIFTGTAQQSVKGYTRNSNGYVLEEFAREWRLHTYVDIYGSWTDVKTLEKDAKELKMFNNIAAVLAAHSIEFKVENVKTFNTDKVGRRTAIIPKNQIVKEKK